ncbi:MAG: hypothetical protein Q9225_005278 [Loekoesia sp. 1 TL-2023]
MTTSSPAKSSIEYDTEDSNSYHPPNNEIELKQSPWKAGSNSLTATVQRPQCRPRPIVRLPPPHPDVLGHQAQDRLVGSPGTGIERHHSTWQERFDGLLAGTSSLNSSPPSRRSNESSFTRTSTSAGPLDTLTPRARTEYPSNMNRIALSHTMHELLKTTSVDPTVPITTQSLKDTLGTATVVGPSDDLVPNGAISGRMIQDREQGVEATSSGRKKRRRNHRGGRKAKLRYEDPRDTSLPPSDTGNISPEYPSHAALLLQSAQTNWENVCRILMGEVSPKDREILRQITDLVGCLGADSGLVAPTDRSSLTDQEGRTLSVSSSECAEEHRMNEGYQAVPGSPEGSQDSFHTVPENRTGNDADEHHHPGQEAVKASQPGDEDEAPVMAQEDKDEQLARLDRITTRLLMRRKEQPLEKEHRRDPRTTSADETPARFQESQYFRDLNDIF